MAVTFPDRNPVKSRDSKRPVLVFLMISVTKESMLSMDIRPQKGPQEKFLSSMADIVIYGGGAGGGKTFGLLLEAARHVANSDYGAVIFRRESVQITNEGGLWDNALALYPRAGARPIKAPKLGFVFPSGARVTFAHLNQETDVLGWQGSQVPMLAFDELCHFERSQFFYLLSRNRSTCGVRPYVRATCNPDADSWVADFIAWWIGEDGFPIQDRAGKIRWFCRIADQIQWADSPADLVAAHGIAPEDAKSVTFIPALVTDNPALMRADPGYMANLKALSRVERERLLLGNWKIKPAAGLYFPRHSVSILDIPPADVIATCRAWDLAATPPTEATPSPDATAGVLMARTRAGRFVVMHALTLRAGAHKVREAILNTASQDGRSIKISIPQDPGQAGKDQAVGYVSLLAGHNITARRPSRDKITRATPFSAQWQAGNVDIVKGPWNEAFLSELESFPESGHDDQVDAAADAFAEIAQHAGPVTIASAGARQASTYTHGYR